MAEQLHSDGRMVSIGRYNISAAGFSGTVSMHESSDATTRSSNPSLYPGELTRALEDSSLTELNTLEFNLDPRLPDTGTTRGRGAGRSTMRLEMKPRRNREQVVLAVDEYGVATWHYPTLSPDGRTNHFTIRSPETVRRASADEPHRGVIGTGARIVKTFIYQATDPVVGGALDKLAGNWEAENRKYRLRPFEPGAQADTDVAPLGDADLERLGSGRALLFIHGTFSTAAQGFGQLPDETLEKLHDAYGGRVFAFDHPTLSEDPIDNVRHFLAALPDGVKLDLDLVAHSRGGLVARTLAGEHNALDIDANQVAVRRVVFAGSPNRGSTLLSPDGLSDLIDRYTTGLNLLPIGPVGEVLDALIVGVKVLARGAIGLEGLTAGDPDGGFMPGFAAQPPAGCTYYGLAADFEPDDPSVGEFFTNKMMDGLMKAENDTVVTAESVALDDMSMHEFAVSDGVHHSGYFLHPRTSDRLTEWLVG